VLIRSVRRQNVEHGQAKPVDDVADADCTGCDHTFTKQREQQLGAAGERHADRERRPDPVTPIDPASGGVTDERTDASRREHPAERRRTHVEGAEEVDRKRDDDRLEQSVEPRRLHHQRLQRPRSPDHAEPLPEVRPRITW
jgi:hypothetical protein